MNAVSCFAGIGGFDKALANVGIPTVAAIEVDSAAQGVLSDQFPETQLFGDIRKVSGADLRAAGFLELGGILTGGFPCQDLSVAGRRAGLAGERSGLFYEFARLLRETRAETFILENVPGLLSSNGGRDMGAVLGALAELGYRTGWRVLDSQFFGVPQRRRRVFFVGSLGAGVRPLEILFDAESCAGNPAPVTDKGTDVAAPPSDGVGTCGADDNQSQAEHLNSLTHVKARRAGEGNPSPKSWRPPGVAPTVDACGHGPRTATAVVTAFHLTQDPISGAVTPAMSAGNSEGCAMIGVQKGMSVRRLTPRECERLQGFPDDWTATSFGKEQKDTARYRQLGNAVTVPVVEWIARRLVRQ